jgi:hypothetical protein
VLRQSMTSVRYGVRDVRHGPGSAEVAGSYSMFIRPRRDRQERLWCHCLTPYLVEPLLEATQHHWHRHHLMPQRNYTE